MRIRTSRGIRFITTVLVLLVDLHWEIMAQTLRRMTSIVRQLVMGGSAVAAEAMQNLGPELKTALQQAAVL